MLQIKCGLHVIRLTPIVPKYTEKCYCVMIKLRVTARSKLIKLGALVINVNEFVNNVHQKLGRRIAIGSTGFLGIRRVCTLNHMREREKERGLPLETDSGASTSKHCM